MTENEAEKLEIPEEIAKANARSRVFVTPAVDVRGLNIDQYTTEAPSITGKPNHG